MFNRDVSLRAEEGEEVPAKEWDLSAISPLSPQSQVMNLDATLARFGGDRRFLTEMARLFLNEDCPRLMAEISRAIAIGDATSLAVAAHSLQNWIGNFSAPWVFEVVRVLEEMGRSGKLDRVEAAHEALQCGIARITAELVEFAGCADPGVDSHVPAPRK